MQGGIQRADWGAKLDERLKPAAQWRGRGAVVEREACQSGGGAMIEGRAASPQAS